ncbi:MAG: hypothetical protein GX601_05955 [Anaerolineales bacterium]|nr:hypothetical protein [Anaerolineales bacterium]
MNFFYYGALYDLQQAAEELGYTSAAEALTQRLATLRDGLMARYWSEEHAAFVDCTVTDETGAERPFFSEHTLSLALRYGLVPAQHVSHVLELLTNGTVPDASPLHKVQKYWTLGEYGRAAAILAEVRTKWLGMSSIEATGTCQESWNVDPDGGGAYCHSASTAPVHTLMAYVLGVRPTKPGFEEFVVHPDPGDLAYANGTVPTPYGDVAVSWTVDGGAFQLQVGVPAAYQLIEETTLDGRVLRRYRRQP